MRNLRTDTSDIGSARAEWLARRIGQEIRIARVTAGLSQAQVARRAGVAQTHVSRTERGRGVTAIPVLARLAAACGHELSIRLFPTASIRLRDSGQLAIAQAISEAADPRWTITLEAPVGSNDRRAADMLLEGLEPWIHVEIERVLVDAQAQLRSAQLKRDALEERHGRAIRLVMAVADTERNRDLFRGIGEVLSRVFPATAAEIRAAIRTGKPLAADGILFVRVRTAGRRG